MKLKDLLHSHDWQNVSVDKDGRTSHATHVLQKCTECGTTRVKTYPGWHPRAAFVGGKKVKL